MNEKPLTLKEVRAAAKRAADEIEKTWPQWKKDLSEPSIVTVVSASVKGYKAIQTAKEKALAAITKLEDAASKFLTVRDENKSVTVKELTEKLSKFPSDMEVMILDGFNAGGKPRIINVGPRIRELDEEDVESNADCEGRIGDKVIVMGYGCY